MGQETEAKTRDILALSRDLMAQVSAIEGDLDRKFRRNQSSGVVQEEAPQEPNILDEIINDLTNVSRRLYNMRDFISTEIINKISEPEEPKPTR